MGGDSQSASRNTKSRRWYGDGRGEEEDGDVVGVEAAWVLVGRVVVFLVGCRLWVYVLEMW